MKPLKQRRPRTRVLVLALVAALALMASIRTCSTRRAVHRLFLPSGGDTIDVAIEYGPMSFYRFDDTLGGFSYDLLRIVSREANIPLKFHPVTVPDKAEEHLLNGDVDMLVAALPATSTSDSLKTSFTVPVYLDRQVLVQRKDSLGKVAISSPLELAGSELWVMADSPIADRLRNLISEIGDTIYVVEDPTYGSEQLVIMTATGDIPAAVVTEATATAMAKDYPELDVSTAVSFTQFQAWKLRRSDVTLRHKLDSAITAIKSTPVYDELMRRYSPERKFQR